MATDQPQLPPREKKEPFPWQKDLAKQGYRMEHERPDPFGLGSPGLWNGLELYGARVHNFEETADSSPIDRIKYIRSIPIRDDDVLIAAFSKSGTHWVWEIVSMLINKTTDYEERTKEFNMLEFCKKDILAQDKSPRVLNSHLWTPHLPQDILKKKTKIIHVVRNPKSVMVSYFFHINQMAGGMLSKDAFIRANIDNTTVHEENQLEYLRHMAAFQKANPDHPVITIYYEHMKKNPMEMTKKLAEYLGAQNTEEFYQQVADACGFDKMKQADIAKRKPDLFNGPVGNVQFYRKGTIGDWKNNLTVAQNEWMDEFIDAQFKKGGLPYEFIYE